MLNRFFFPENYITQNLCSEIVALAVLLVHYWRARLRSYVKEKRDSAYTSAGALLVCFLQNAHFFLPAGSARTDKSAISGVQSGASGTSAASGTSGADDDDELANKSKPQGKTIGGDFEQQVITL